MLVGAKVCELTDGFLWFVCGLYVGILTSPLTTVISDIYRTHWECQLEHTDNMVPPPGAMALTTSATQTPKVSLRVDNVPLYGICPYCAML